MVDNIHFDKISPLLSSTERIKRVDRRPRDDEQAPLKGNPQGKKKKKKKKKHPGRGASPSEITLSKVVPLPPGLEVKNSGKEQKRSSAKRRNRIIDIRV